MCDVPPNQTQWYPSKWRNVLCVFNFNGPDISGYNVGCRCVGRLASNEWKFDSFCTHYMRWILNAKWSCTTIWWRVVTDDDGDVIVTQQLLSIVGCNQFDGPKMRSLIFGIRARQFEFPWTWFAGHSILFHFSESMGVHERLDQLSTKCQFSVNSLLSSRAINAHILRTVGARSNLYQSVSLMIITFCAKKCLWQPEESNNAMDKHALCGGQTVAHKVGYRLIELRLELDGTSQHILYVCCVCAHACVYIK